MVENRLQLRSASEHDTNVYRTQVEQQPEIAQIAIKKRIFIVSL